MKKANRPFANFLRACGFRGPPDDQRFDISPNLQPVAVVANEPENLIQYFATYSGGQIIGVNQVVLEVQCRVPIRLKAAQAWGAGAGLQHQLRLSNSTTIIAGAAAVTPASSTGAPSRCLARTGQAPAAIAIGRVAHHLSNVSAFGVLQWVEPFIVPAGRIVTVCATGAVAGATEQLALRWEELV